MTTEVFVARTIKIISQLASYTGGTINVMKMLEALFGGNYLISEMVGVVGAVKKKNLKFLMESIKSKHKVFVTIPKGSHVYRNNTL